MDKKELEKRRIELFKRISRGKDLHIKASVDEMNRFLAEQRDLGKDMTELEEKIKESSGKKK